jgi:hypothetical protein
MNQSATLPSLKDDTAVVADGPGDSISPAPADAHITVGRMSLIELRNLYGRTGFVVVPLMPYKWGETRGFLSSITAPRKALASSHYSFTFNCFAHACQANQVRFTLVRARQSSARFRLRTAARLKSVKAFCPLATIVQRGTCPFPEIAIYGGPSP